MNERRGHRGWSWQASFTAAVVIVGILYIVGSVRGATMDAVTPRVMAAELKAIHYPVAHPKRLSCRTVSVQLGEFKCVATITNHRRRTVFVRVYGGNSGWMCAGKHLAGCKMLRQGFYPSSLATAGWQERVVEGWATITTGTDPGTVLCTGSSSPMVCGQWTLTYHHTKLGYVMSVSQ